MRTLSSTELDDILLGCTIVGTGGGGETAEGRRLLDAAFAAGRTFTLVTLDELPDDALVASPYYCGSLGATEAARLVDPTSMSCPSLLALRALERFLGRPVGAVITTELGGFNSAVAFHAAAMAGIPIVDADPAGRSVPELDQTSFCLEGIPIDPLAVATGLGDALVISQVADDRRAEAIVRSIAVASNNFVAVVDHPLDAKRLRTAVIRDAVSYAQKLGEAYRAAVASGEDAAQAVGRFGGGRLLFRGTISSVHSEERGGWTVGEVTIAGTGDDAGSRYRLAFKNEYYAGWRDDELDVTDPDLLCTFDETHGGPLVVSALVPGLLVSVVGLPAAPIWQTERGLERLGPARFGIAAPYVPLGMQRPTGPPS
jgi:uncharacterized protein